ncbi:hypothetical protein [Rhodococcus sp. NPDC057529]|uniref:hypothetical protein n=1 Tax=Rhodococcus sp. NPDC057529 TaxID=3346158 RepID=UPI00366D6A8F
MRALTATHDEEKAEQHRLVESLRTRVAERENEIALVPREADRASAAAAATVSRSVRVRTILLCAAASVGEIGT